MEKLKTFLANAPISHTPTHIYPDKAIQYLQLDTEMLVRPFLTSDVFLIYTCVHKGES